MFVTTMVYLYWIKMISVPNLIYFKDLIWKKIFTNHSADKTKECAKNLQQTFSKNVN